MATDTSTKPDSEISPAGEWHRLSPVASLYYLLKTLKGLVSHALPSLAPMVVVILSSNDKATMFTLVLLGVSTMLVVSSLLQYWFFTYQLADNEIRVNQGVLKRQHRVINFDRIQNININQPVYFRPFKLVTLVIETAGSKGGEGDLAGIPTTMANSIRDKILLRQSQLKTTQAAESESLDDLGEVTPDNVIATASFGDIVRYGLSNNGMYLLLAFMAPFFNRFDNIVNYFFTDAQLKAIADLLGGEVIGVVIMIAAFMLSVFLLLILISVIGSLLKFHNYRLTLSDEILKRKSGLINTHEESLNLSKIQAMARSCNFIGHWLGRENLVCRQTSTGGNKQQKSANVFIVPARTADECDQLTKTLYPDFNDDIDSHPINRRYILKTWLLKLLLPVVLLSSPVIYHEGMKFMAVWLIPVLLFPLVVKRWRKYRYGKNGEYGLITSGFIGHKKVLFPFFKVQRASISQSPIQKRRDLATLTIYLASGRLQIPYMPMEHAQQWFDWIYAKTETDNRPWF